MTPKLKLRIEQLIALTASPAEEEARSSALIACKLIREHGLVLADPPPVATRGQSASRRSSPGARTEPHDGRASSASGYDYGTEWKYTRGGGGYAGYDSGAVGPTMPRRDRARPAPEESSSMPRSEVGDVARILSHKQYTTAVRLAYEHGQGVRSALLFFSGQEMDLRQGSKLAAAYLAVLKAVQARGK